jgi:hypothetical protein
MAGLLDLVFTEVRERFTSWLMVGMSEKYGGNIAVFCEKRQEVDHNLAADKG